jgi:hypothetical protein
MVIVAEFAMTIELDSMTAIVSESMMVTMVAIE